MTTEKTATANEDYVINWKAPEQANELTLSGDCFDIFCFQGQE